MQAIASAFQISGGLGMVMPSFDPLTLGIRLFDPSNSIVALNLRLHYNKVYNAFRFTISTATPTNNRIKIRISE